MSQFVFEIGMEEMPAGFLPGLENHSKTLFTEQFTEEFIPYAGIEVASTPRRLVVQVQDLAPRQSEQEELLIGPPRSVAYDEEGALSKAGQGFLRSKDVLEDDLFIHSTEKGDYLAVRKKVGGAETLSRLPGICQTVLRKLPFPKKMRWEQSAFVFGRPIRWLLALLDDAVVPVQIASKTAGNLTYGHRVLGPGPWEVPDAGSYCGIIAEQGRVTLGIQKRADLIQEQGDALAAAKEGRVVWKKELLQEVACLVECPKPVLGRYDEKFLDIPREVLLTCMESHQKCFGLEDATGRLLPYFLTTLNLEPEDLELVRTGWERVLRARLEDAAFFWKVDSGATLEQWREELNKVVFLGPLGSMGDKANRLADLAGLIAGQLAPELKDDLCRAAQLAKTDLVSEMVGEFATLQGIMGSIYADQKSEAKAVGQAILEQYRPVGHDSPVPDSRIGSLLAVTDKLDNLIGCFGLNMIPSGTQDPYALRRQALGIIRIVFEQGLRFSLPAFIDKAQSVYGDTAWKLEPDTAKQRLLDFFAQRLKVYFTDQGFETRIVEAILGTGIEDILSLKKRLLALKTFSLEPGFEQAVLTFKRAANIIRKQGEAAGDALSGLFDQGMMLEPEEKALAERIDNLAPEWDALWQEEKYPQLLALLGELRPLVDRFFDQVMVMAEDPALRRNRLNMLTALVNRLNRLADFNALQI